MLPDVRVVLLIFAAASQAAVASGYPVIMPHNISQLTYPSSEGRMARIWTKADLGRASSVLSYEQMGPLVRRLVAGLPITVLAFGDSITKDHGGCFHRDRCECRGRCELNAGAGVYNPAGTMAAPSKIKTASLMSGLKNGPGTVRWHAHTYHYQY